MAMIKCPECGQEISDKAVNCPKCGFPLDNTEKNEKANNHELPVKESKKSKKGLIIAIGIIAIVIVVAVYIANSGNETLGGKWSAETDGNKASLEFISEEQGILTVDGTQLKFTWSYTGDEELISGYPSREYSGTLEDGSEIRGSYYKKFKFASVTTPMVLITTTNHGSGWYFIPSHD